MTGGGAVQIILGWIVGAEAATRNLGLGVDRRRSTAITPCRPCTAGRSPKSVYWLVLRVWTP
jgi:hypothetical protein